MVHFCDPRIMVVCISGWKKTSNNKRLMMSHTFDVQNSVVSSPYILYHHTCLVLILQLLISKNLDFFASWGVTKFLGNRIFIAVSETDFGKSRWLVIVGYPFLPRHCERKIWLCMRILWPCSYVNSFFLGGGGICFLFCCGLGMI